IIERDFGGASCGCVKDPRITRLLPFWDEVLDDADLGYAIALRNPVSVARSLGARNGFSAEKSYLLWLLHMVAAMLGTRGRRRVVVDYDEMLANPGAQLSRIAKVLGLRRPTPAAIAEYADAFLSPLLRHSGHTGEDLRGDSRASALVVQAYELLRAH